MSADTARAIAPALVPYRRRSRRRWLWAVATAAVAAGCAAAAWYGWRAWQSAAPAAIPSFRIEPGTVRIVAYAKGTLQGGQADRLLAPSIGGAMPRISFLLPAGTEVHAGDVVVRFNTGQEQFQLAKAVNAAQAARANIAAARDQARAQAIQDAYSLQHARFEVQLAKIAVRQNPLLPVLTARQNLLTLRSARAELRQWERDAAKRQASGRGMIAIQLAAAAKAQSQAAAARRHIAAMTLRVARAGYVAIEPDTSGMMDIFQGMTVQPYHVGAQASPGTVVAEIPDLSELRVRAHLGEAGSAYVAKGQSAEVQIEGLPGQVFPARVLRVSGLQGNVFSPGQSETCVLALRGSDPALRPGMDARARIVLSQMRHVLWVPAEALFRQNGKSIVYVRRGGAFSPQPVKVLRQGATRVAITGVRAGTVIALSNPLGAAMAQP